jgi:hypothetical protein
MASQHSSPNPVGLTLSGVPPGADLLALAVLIESAVPAIPASAHLTTGEKLSPALTDAMRDGTLALRHAARHARNAAAAIERGDAFRGSAHAGEAVRLFHGGMTQLRAELARLVQSLDRHQARQAQERLDLLEIVEPALG